MLNLSLIGFMGTGKSSVGRLAAELLQFEFVDTDRLIEETAGTTISEIFRAQGEPLFRSLECRTVEQLAAREKLVIATGGGVPIQEKNMQSLRRHSLVVCLWASPEKIFERVSTHTHRPLLQDENPLEKIRGLLAVREPYYRQADVLVNTEMRSLREVAMQVVHHFQTARSTQQ